MSVRILALAAVLCSTLAARADLTLAPLFRDHLVLQRGVPVPVWGTATPGAKVVVTLAQQHPECTAGADGKWSLALAPLTASEIGTAPRQVPPGAALVLTVASGDKTLTIKDILVGEVWLCSGQSNMQMVLANAADAARETAAADYPAIRLFDAQQMGAGWALCTPARAANFSAVGYFFARELQTKLHVPVGLINASVGGTPIQLWASAATAKTVPLMQPELAKMAAANAAFTVDKEAYRKDEAAAGAANQAAKDQWLLDCASHDVGVTQHWAAPATATTGWADVALPMPDAAASVNDIGCVWARLDLTLPKEWVGKELSLNLGAMDDADITFVNGQEIGRTWYGGKMFWWRPRHYTVPAELVKTPQLTIAIQVINVFGIGGFLGLPDYWWLAPAEDAHVKPMSLATTWKYHAGSPIDLATQPQPTMLHEPASPTGSLGALYTQLIAPLMPYAIKGALWYQGENNAPEPALYAQYFPAMIRDWRAAWGQGDFPFYFVQLAGFQARQRAPIELGSWADVREAQLAALALPHTGVALAIDIGDAQDIHPQNKQEVGRRLALCALAQDYAQPVEFSGPQYKSLAVDGATLRLSFTHADGLRASGPGPLQGFAIAGADQIFHWATATLAGDTVVLSSPAVPAPLAARYAWAYLPLGNLVNRAALPAIPFRTDAWPPATVKSE